MKTSIDYEQLEHGTNGFDYEGLMKQVPYSFETVRRIRLVERRKYTCLN